jgi:hypothetical protein
VRLSARQQQDSTSTPAVVKSTLLIRLLALVCEMSKSATEMLVQTWLTLPWLENRRFKFKQSRQFFIRTHNVTLWVIAMRISNPDRSPVGINR